MTTSPRLHVGSTAVNSSAKSVSLAMQEVQLPRAPRVRALALLYGATLQRPNTVFSAGWSIYAARKPRPTCHARVHPRPEARAAFPC